MSEGYDRFLGSVVVADTPGPFVYVGRLVEANDRFLTLEDADIFDTDSCNTTKAVYLAEARRSGFIPTRKSVHVKQDMVVSLSRLEDILLY
ncbi:MAG: hypothetical protein V1918_04170 [Planctomycetota bacterium]